MDVDLIIKNGVLVDGTGNPAYKADLAVAGDRILEIAPEGSAALEGVSAAEVLDAAGLTVAPGFIDMHSHNDFVVLQDDHPKLLACMLEQGCTTFIGGNCGFSPAPYSPYSRSRDYLDFVGRMLSGVGLPMQWGAMDSFLGYLEERGVAMNVAQLEGHGTLRVSKLGRNYSLPAKAEMALLERAVDDSLESGAFGLSFGLGYEPGMFVDLIELERLAERTAEHGAILAVHLKALSRISPGYGVSPFGEPHNIRALKEIIAIAERTGVKLQISHLIFVGENTWPTVDPVLEIIDRAHEGGVDVALDSYPQTAGNTTILALYPDWFLKDINSNFGKFTARLRLDLEWSIGFRLIGFGLGDVQLLHGAHPELEKYNGMFFGGIAKAMGVSTRAAFLRATQMSNGMATCLLHKYSGDEKNQDALRKVLAHPLNLFMTDALVNARGAANPGAYGTFPLLIQKIHKEWGLLSLEETIARMTGKSAERFGLEKRGVLAAGNYADITVFDYETIRDNTSTYETRRRPTGIRHVFVNGRRAVRDGMTDLDRLCGKVLRRT